MESRKELCGGGKDHLTSYADLSLPFTIWIKGAESRLQSDAKLPKSKEQLLTEKEELDVSRSEFLCSWQHHVYSIEALSQLFNVFSFQRKILKGPRGKNFHL